MTKKLKPLPTLQKLDTREARSVCKWYGIDLDHNYDQQLHAFLEEQHALLEANKWGAAMIAKLVQAGHLKPCEDPVKALELILSGDTH